eukprot:TCONS_00061724-protein
MVFVIDSIKRVDNFSFTERQLDELILQVDEESSNKDICKPLKYSQSNYMLILYINRNEIQRDSWNATMYNTKKSTYAHLFPRILTLPNQKVKDIIRNMVRQYEKDNYEVLSQIDDAPNQHDLCKSRKYKRSLLRTDDLFIPVIFSISRGDLCVPGDSSCEQISCSTISSFSAVVTVIGRPEPGFLSMVPLFLNRLMRFCTEPLYHFFMECSLQILYADQPFSI